MGRDVVGAADRVDGRTVRKRGEDLSFTGQSFMPLIYARHLVSRTYMTGLREELSTQNGHLAIVKLLLERDTKRPCMNDQGQTPYQALLQSTIGRQKSTTIRSGTTNGD
jgi:hypothetical protein